jgi:dipeptidase
MYASMTEIPECYRVGNGDFIHFSWTSAFWIHNWVANMAYSRYDQMINDTKPLQDKLENSYLETQAEIERKALELLRSDRKASIAFLTNYSVEVAQKAFEDWKKLGETLVVKYMDGVVKKEKDGQFITNEYGGSLYPNRPKLNEDFLREIVKQKGEWLREKEIKK